MQSKNNESNAEERDAWHYFLKKTKFGREQHAAGSLQYNKFQLWRWLFTDKLSFNYNLIMIYAACSFRNLLWLFQGYIQYRTWIIILTCHKIAKAILTV